MAAPVQNQQAILQAYYANVVSRTLVLDAKSFSVSQTQGQQITFDLPHAGVPRYLILAVQGTFARTEGTTVSTVTASPKYPFNLLQGVTLNDYLGYTRVQAGGYELYLLDLAKAFGFDPATPPLANAATDSAVFADTIPAGTASTTTTSAVVFYVVVPVSAARNSIKGSYVAQISDGTAQLIINLAAPVGSTLDSPVSTSGGTPTITISGTITPLYVYYDVPTGIKIPASEVSVVHEVIQSQSSDNLAAGQEKKYVLPTGRTYYRILEELVLNDALDTLDAALLKFVVNDSTPILEYNLVHYLAWVRQRYGRDFPTGLFLYDFAEKPWRPMDYGSLDIRVTLGASANVAGTSYVRILRDALTAGSLSSQAAGLVG